MRPAAADEQVRQHVGGGAGLVVAVGRALHDGRVGAERGVVDERPVADEAEVDAQLDAVAEPVEAGRRVLPVQPEIEGEVVAGTGRDDQQREVVLGGDAGDQRLGAVPAGHAEQVGAVGHRHAGELTDIDGPGTLQQRDLGARASAFSLSPNLATFPPPERGFMIR